MPVHLAATAPSSPSRTYSRRKPEDTLLYQAVETYFDEFVEYARERNGHPLPAYVVRAFERYLACGRLDYGFARVQCPRCCHEFAVGFSCKDRGLCPSCGQGRMCDLAAQLADRVFPANAPVRQWVLSVPWELRILVARDPKVLSQLVRVLHDEVARSYLARVQSGLGGERRCAAISMIQRFSGSLGVNVHDHSVWLDGVYVLPHGDGMPVFVAAEPPTHEQIERVARRVRDRVVRWLRRTRRLDDRAVEERSNEASETDALGALLFAGSGRGTLGVVPDAAGEGREPSDQTHLDAQRVRGSRWAANVEGFSVHAGTTVDEGNRFGLEQLLRYCARPAVSLERLSRLPDGRFAYRVKHPIGQKTHRIMEPMERMARLASVVAPPRYPLLRYFGLFAPGCKARKRIVPGRATNPKRCCSEHERSDTKSPARNLRSTEPASPVPAAPRPDAAPPVAVLNGGTRIPWAELLRHGVGLDALRCPNCAATMNVLAVVKDPEQRRRYLHHAGIATRDDVPQRAWDPVPIDPLPPDHAVA